MVKQAIVDMLENCDSHNKQLYVGGYPKSATRPARTYLTEQQGNL